MADFPLLESPKLSHISGRKIMKFPHCPSDSFRFLQILCSNKSLFNFQGQFKQAAIVDLFLNKSKTNGFFFEAGAYDGVVASNTLLFETRYNWTGLLVEANPDNYDLLLEKNRKAYSIGTCLSMNTYPEVVYFDATTIFGGILREGFVKPGDNIPVTDRERQKELAMPTRRTIKVSLFTS